MTTKVHVIAIAVLGLTLLGVTHAAASIYDDCSIACADECSWMKPRRCRRAFRKCVRKGVWVCGGLPTTTTTSLPPTTTTTLPQSGCPASYPYDCGDGYCCPSAAPLCCSISHGCCPVGYNYCDAYNCYQ